MNATTSARWAAAAVLVLASGCATAPRWERYEAPPVGTTWVNQVRGTGSYSGSAEVQSRMGQMTWAGQPHIAFHNGPTTLVARPDGAWVTLLGADGKPATSWDPPASMGWPMQVGGTWKTSYRMVNHVRNTSMAVDAAYLVEAYEDVTVAAGTFKVYRVRMTNNIGDDNTWWFSAKNGLFIKQKLVRGNKSPFGAGTRESELKALKLAK